MCIRKYVREDPQHLQCFAVVGLDNFCFLKAVILQLLLMARVSCGSLLQDAIVDNIDMGALVVALAVATKENNIKGSLSAEVAVVEVTEWQNVGVFLTHSSITARISGLSREEWG